MKLIERTDMQHHAIPVNPWPLWAFNAWCNALGQSYEDDEIKIGRVFKAWCRFRMWLFGWWIWV